MNPNQQNYPPQQPVPQPPQYQPADNQGYAGQVYPGQQAYQQANSPQQPVPAPPGDQMPPNANQTYPPAKDYQPTQQYQPQSLPSQQYQPQGQPAGYVQTPQQGSQFQTAQPAYATPQQINYAAKGHPAIRKFVFIVAAMLFVGGAVIGGLSLFGSSSYQEVEQRSDSTLNTSSTYDASKNIKSQQISASLNQQVNLSDGFSYMVISVDDGWQPDDSRYQPAAGNKYVNLELVVGNRDSESIYYVSAADFKLKDSSGETYTIAYLVTDRLLSNSLMNVRLESSEQVSGAQIYEIPEDVAPVSLQIDKQYKEVNSGEVVSISSEVVFE